MLKGNNLWFRYGKQSPWVVEARSLAVAPGEILGLMAPSGYGKTTLGKLLAGYLRPSRGTVSVDGRSLPKKSYCPVQLVFQNPELAINPRWRIRQILEESHPPNPHWLEAFGIYPGWLSRYPHELSGGELQRVAIARVLNPATRYLIADEMTAMLDANTQALIWQGVLTFARQQQVGLIVISHDQPLLKRICDRILDLRSCSTAPKDLLLSEQLGLTLHSSRN
ncbi:ABC transporter, ATP-binding protein, putative [Synechococcus sp. PCC 7335]|uniref:ABC transporter ATP-binding protein n=1 Tax=Synechococcus sp. (strain ATCC 29403 / PCC 7335) TaxID=91464 RepID=UPI00017ED215|nr:ATP-binding cassette domain-containing protein [Synechococcus sp. PCC 7335]EDX84095.1 ABC transporter, ATP-binding protein, putative [Synechococcus sp. PCC 7335]